VRLRTYNSAFCSNHTRKLQPHGTCKSLRLNCKNEPLKGNRSKNGVVDEAGQ
jgi:hypothetical protein